MCCLSRIGTQDQIRVSTGIYADDLVLISEINIKKTLGQ